MALTKCVAEIVEQDTSGLLGAHPSWQRVPLREVAQVLNGFPFDSAGFNADKGMRLTRIRDVVAGSTSTWFDGQYDRAYVLADGDLLVGMDGDFNCARWRGGPALLNQRVCRISVDSNVYDPRLLDALLPVYLAAINAETSSVTVKHLSSRTIEDIWLPLPPRIEQERLAEKLDELMGDLDAATGELKAAKRKLALYRQSLLKSAVEGGLTAEWRRQHPPQEAGTELLVRILRERTSAAKRDALEPDLTEAPKLPPGWAWASLDHLLCSLRSGTAETSGRDVTPFPVLKSSAVRHGSIDYAQLNYLDSAQSRAENFLATGDLLITRLSGSVEYVGCAAMVESEQSPRVQYPDRVFCGKPVTGAAALMPLVVLCFEAGFIRARVEAAAKSTAGHKRISMTDLRPLPVPIPPLAEAARIIEVCRATFESTQEVLRAIDQQLALAATQRQNILRAAFSGQLVPQDPNDEPASVLLERIRARHDAAGDKPTARRTRRAKIAA